MAKTYNPMPRAAKVARTFMRVQAVAVFLIAALVAIPVVTGGGVMKGWLKGLIHLLGIPAGVALPDTVPAFVREQRWPVVAVGAVAALLWLLIASMMRGQKRLLWLVVVAAEIALIAADIAAIWVVKAPVYSALLALIVPLVVTWNLFLRVPRRWFHH